MSLLSIGKEVSWKCNAIIVWVCSSSFLQSNSKLEAWIEYLFLGYICIVYYLNTYETPPVFSTHGVLNSNNLPKVRGTETTNRIPPLCSVPWRAWNDWTAIRRDVESAETVASSALAGRDVVQAKLTSGVNPWVQEAQRWEVGWYTSRVEQCNDSVECRCCTRSSSISIIDSLVNDSEVLSLCCNIWESTSLSIVETLEVIANLGEILGDSEFLVQRTRPNVRETARGEEDGNFGLDVTSSADTGDVWAGSRELGLEFQGILAVVGEAVVTRSWITGGEDDGFSSGAELGEEVADLGSVADWDFLLVLAVGDGDTVRNILVGELGKRKEEIEVGLVGVVGSGWAVSIGDQKSPAASADSVTGVGNPTPRMYWLSRLASPESLALVWSLRPPLNWTTVNWFWNK